MTAEAPVPTASSDANRRRLAPVLLVLTTLAALVPFLDKPFHLDDPVFLWVADQIRRQPLDPYGFDANWYGTAKPMHDMNKNPPLLGYYIAAVDATVGRSEVALHAAFMLPAIAVVLGTYFLARELGVDDEKHASLAGLLTLFTPVFLVSASTVMLDVMMLAWWVWAAWAWVRGIDRGRAGLLWLAAGGVVAAAMTKYFGVALIPLLAAHGLIRHRGRPGAWLLPLLLPVAALVAYQVVTRQMYGRGLLTDAGAFANVARAAEGATVPLRILTGLSFVGGGALTVALAMLAPQRKRSVITWLGVFAAVAVILLAWDPYRRYPLHGAEGGVKMLYWLQLGAFVSAGAGIVAAGIALVRRRGWRDADAMLLLLWLLGTLTFASLLNWTVNGRSVLAATPAAAIVAARMLASSSAGSPDAARRRVLAVVTAVLVLGVALSLACTQADTAHARAACRTALSLRDRFRDHPRPLFFLGHWGLQYYLEAGGRGRALDPLAGDVRGGDLVVIPLNNSYNLTLAPAVPDALPVIHQWETPTLGWLATMDDAVNAGFYSDIWGPLPYGFGRVPPDRYVVKRIDGPIRAVLRSEVAAPAFVRTGTSATAPTPRTSD